MVRPPLAVSSLTASPLHHLISSFIFRFASLSWTDYSTLMGQRLVTRRHRILIDDSILIPSPRMLRLSLSVPSRSHRRDSTTRSLPCPQATRRKSNSTRTRQQTRETDSANRRSISPIDIHAHASQATFSPASLPCVGPHSSTQAPSPHQSARHTICDRHTARRDPFSSSRRAFLHSAPSGQDGSDPCAIARGSARGGLSLADAVFVCLLLDRSWLCRRRMNPLSRG
ncbi:hypothetical protein V8C44DRAFT_327522 [Trichoderma aethiopicum]